MKDLTGKTLIRSPKWEGSLFLDLSFPVGGSLAIGANFLVTYKDKFYHQPDLDELDAQDARNPFECATLARRGRWDMGCCAGRSQSNQREGQELVL